MIVTLLELAKGNVSFGGAVFIILLVSEFFIPLRLLGSFFHIAMNGMAACDKIFALLDLPEPEEKTAVLTGASMDICLKGVQFSYEKERKILEEISMDLPAGSFTSLVGTSGCGKSTIAGILMGRNRGYRGSITMQEKELKELSEKSLMEHVTACSPGCRMSCLFPRGILQSVRTYLFPWGVLRLCLCFLLFFGEFIITENSTAIILLHLNSWPSSGIKCLLYFESFVRQSWRAGIREI